MTSRPLITVVDDDESVRESLPDLLAEFGFAASAFASADELLASDSLQQTRCLILDIAMPGMSGPELHQELLRRGHTIPVVFITAQADESMRATLVERGAIACLSKPFSERALQAALNTALGGP
ncbi:MAG TPA: response regulator [Steroidobacteraceae bacterium]